MSIADKKCEGCGKPISPLPDEDGDPVDYCERCRIAIADEHFPELVTCQRCGCRFDLCLCEPV